MTIGDQNYTVAIWDTAGEERFSALTTFYTRQANCAVIVYDVTDKTSFRAVEKWANQLDSDVIMNIQSYAQSVNALTMEGSAVTGEKVQDMFERV